MCITGKTGYVEYQGKKWRFLNQRSRDWTHPYEYPPEPGGTLTNSGCGIFGACFAVQKMCGKEICVEALADFSCANGGRGDDGTDRPMLLKAMQEKGLAKEYGFQYNFDGLLNDHDALWNTMLEGGCALCNLRVGHIVALVDYREVNGEKQLLVIDSHSESADSRVTNFVREVVDGSEVIYETKNEAGLVTGSQTVYGMFWVPLSLPKDFNLLHPVK
ncbi:MAG: hypothetical protein IJC48_00180 [Clostridia bacterium]|nr:hypothetical protein [Clostridia bacterium]MBQ4157224.1 hypothetical protein [Clostridia bacterium]